MSEDPYLSLVTHHFFWLDKSFLGNYNGSIHSPTHTTKGEPHAADY